MKAEEKKSLVLLIPGFPSDESDTTCLPAQQAFVLAAKKKYPTVNITVIAFQYPFRLANYEWNGITVIALNGRNKGNFSRIMVWIRAWRVLVRLKKDGSLLGLLSFWCTECGLIGKWFAKWKKLTHYCWILGQDARKENGFVRFIKPQPTELIALSEFLMNEFLSNHGIKPFMVIPNAIDRGSFPALTIERTIDVIGVGSLIKLKRYDIFIAIIKKAVERFPSLRTIICGQGPEEQSLQELINEYGLKENIQLVGEKPHARVLELMQESKMLLHPSAYEGFSSVCAEALYAGTHVISFRAPSIKVIEHWHVVNTEEEMLKKLIELLSDPVLDHNRVLLQSIEQSAEMMMNLFDQREVTAR